MNSPIATLRWTHEGTLNSTHHVYRVPFLTHPVDTIEFHRKVTRTELAAFATCLPAGKWKMAGDTKWRTDSLTGALADGE